MLVGFFRDTHERSLIRIREMNFPLVESSTQVPPYFIKTSPVSETGSN
jgi:hypothetical protein